MARKDWDMHCPDSPLFAEYLALADEAGWEDLLAKDSISVGNEDCLVVVDMQNDFIPADALNSDGGHLAVAEGANIVPLIVKLMQHFAASGSLVVATRDYHPVDHCSFIPCGGVYPTHCVQGSAGSYFYSTIGDCMMDLMMLGRRAEVVFKGFHEDTDSYGSFAYPDNPTTWDRVTHRMGNADRLYGCSLCDWTGSMSLKCSNLRADINAPPDVLAAHGRVTLTDMLKTQGIKRVFACGLALDLCVFDTCLNARAAMPSLVEVSMLMDAARAVHLPGLGQVGSGFTHDLKEMQRKFSRHRVSVRPSATVLPGSFQAEASVLDSELIGKVFPEKLGPFAFIPVLDLTVTVDTQGLTYEASQADPGADVQSLRLYDIEPRGRCSPAHALTLSASSLAAMGIPTDATQYVWAYAVSDDSFDDHARAYFSITTPAAAFFVFGGFMYLDANGSVVAVMSLTLGTGLAFGVREPWKPQFTSALQERWHPVTVPFMKRKGAEKMVWIQPNEVLTSADDGEKWTAPHHGCFAYLFHEDESAHDDRDCFFAVTEMTAPKVASLGRMNSFAKAATKAAASAMARLSALPAQAKARLTTVPVTRSKPVCCWCF